mmetsp:Transcript_2505/g.3786  ORF Transcript_2505/g.3786 Transcript_2505/m.3786 type:complete len:234 (-) Transcript_2505:89-790(-)|eukprot:CAMPEP_0195508360 /NCGR_PEP_ID=MMETSP0794_2-20130614/1587_1 /TAXON_ID=515487 /ORGANISM="Stephanopyxis turris, Strain CCMP 815" /LENGTH=233 /DNA_ID=CAMNT_0040635297 /DNA_START=35 /DNA_END=736 /DNA_ORIENTATION=-
MGSKRRKEEKKERKKDRKRRKSKDPSIVKTETPQKKGLHHDDASTIITSSSANNDTNNGTPFQKQQLRLHVSLLPYSLDNIPRHINRSIGSLLMKYHQGMNGVLLSYDNVRSSKKSRGFAGIIMNELPHVHFDVEVDALVFCANVGMKLPGVVNESFPSHLGILVFSVFNAMVSADQLQKAGYSYDRSTQTWANKEGTSIGVNTSINFTVDKIHECMGVLSMEGLNPTSVVED